MKIIESHNYISWSVVNCGKELSVKFKNSLSKQQAYSICCSENCKQYKLRQLWDSMCSGDLEYEPNDAAIIAKFLEMKAKILDVDFDFIN